MPHRVAAIDDLVENEPKVVDVDGTKVLLVRRGERVHALQGLCPHKKVPLDKGIVDGDRIVCGIHRAAFALETGEVVEPPACESLARYDVTLEGSDVLVTIPPDTEPHPVPPMASRTAGSPDTRHFVIVGAGGAGWTAAETLRREGFTGRVTVFSDEERLPFDRTDLSKAFLKADDPATPWRRDEAFLKAHDLTLREGVVESVNYDAGRVVLHGGETMAFDKLLIAPGCEARTPNIPGIDLAGVHTLRDLEDAKAIREAVRSDRVKRVVVIGGGFIGMEAAAALSSMDGIEVSVALRNKVPFKSILGEQMGRRLRREHEARDVRFLVGEVERIDEADGALAVVLGNGERAGADLVIVGVGAVPRTGWADLPTDEDGGLSVEADLSVPDHENVWAAGDVARLPTRWGKVRIEHWRHAMQLGELAARNMLGRNERYDEAPFFWTAQQIEGSYFYTGHAEDWDATTIEGDPDSPDFIVRYERDGKVMATFGHGMLADQAAIERRMAKEGPLPS